MIGEVGNSGAGNALAAAVIDDDRNVTTSVKRRMLYMNALAKCKTGLHRSRRRFTY